MNVGIIYLIKGTGYAWAWHSMPKLEPSIRTIILPSEENVGGFAPTGSIWKNCCWKHVKLLLHWN